MTYILLGASKLIQIFLPDMCNADFKQSFLTDRLGGKEAPTFHNTYQTFFCIFPMNFAMATLGLENAKKNLVFHFGVGRYASSPQKPVVKEKLGFFGRFLT